MYITRACFVALYIYMYIRFFLVSGGCGMYPSICRDKDEIERLENEIKKMRTTYDAKYLDNKKAYLELRTANTDNAYIMFFINETLQGVHKLQEYQDLINHMFEVEHDELFKMFKNNPNSTVYLNSVIGELEYSLSDLKKMIDATRYSQMFNLAIQYLIEFTLSRFVNSYSRAYDQVALPEDVKISAINRAMWEADVTEAGILLDPAHPKYQKVCAKYGVPTAEQISLKQDLKLAPKVFQQMGENFKNKATSTGTSLEKIAKSKTFKEFSGRVEHKVKHVQHSLEGFKHKTSKVSKFVTDPDARKYFVKNYKLSWAEGGMMVLGAIGDAVQIFLDMKQWKEVANEMRKARNQFTDYRNKLRVELKSIDDQTRKIAKEWPEVIEVFKNLSLSFKEMIDNGTKYAEFNDVLGLPKLPVDVNSPLFSLNFSATTKANLKSAQAAVIDFVKGTDNDIRLVADRLRARTILYKNVQTMTTDKKSLHEILVSVKNIYRFMKSHTVKDFGERLKKQDIACCVSILRKTYTSYNGFQLEPFRPRCDVTTDDFWKMDAAAAAARAARAGVATAVNMCKYGFCPCPAAIAQMNDISESVVIDIIRSIRPTWTKYCGVSGCACVTLRN